MLQELKVAQQELKVVQQKLKVAQRVLKVGDLTLNGVLRDIRTVLSTPVG